LPVNFENITNVWPVRPFTLPQDLRLEPEEARLSIPADPAVRATLTSWVNEHWDGVFGLAYRLTRSRHEAEDLAQDAFLKAAGRHESFTAGTNLRAWLLRIVTNAFLDGRRREKASPLTPMGETPFPANGPAPGRAIENRELAQALESAMSELSDVPRTVFLLRTQEQMSFRDIAQIVGTSEETARWHMLQARRQLMQRMQGWI
jgi:RNA polymerase sigma-70 factor (ECF subfamily)